MSLKQYGALGDTFYLWFGANDTSGSGGDGASPAADVRLAGAAAGAAPVYSPTPVLLTHADYPAGAHEVAIAATAGNGFSTGNTYAVFCTLAIDSQNPTGFIGSFDLKPIQSALISTGADLILKDSIFALAIAAAIWDKILTGATHNIASSAGRRVREIGAFAIHSGTAQAGDSNSITLVATADAADGIYNRNLIVLVDNTGVGQTRTIVDYDGSTKIAVVDRDWRTTPDATTEYQITPYNTPLVVDQGVAQAGSTSTTIKLRAYASAVNDVYLCNVLAIIAGTGRGQARLVGAYNGTTKVITICGDDWVTTPDATSVYVMMPYGTTCTSCIGDHALGLINTECDLALNTAIPGSPTADSINQRIKAMDELTEGSGSGDLAAIKTKTDNLPSGITKGVALSNVPVFMVLASDDKTAATSKTVVCTLSKDGAAFVASTNSVTEISAGMYKIDLTAAELNYDVVILRFTNADCNDRVISINTS